MQFILTCPFSTAQIAKKELDILGYKAQILTPTVLTFTADEEAIARININSRIGNKLYIQMQTGKAKTFQELFDVVGSIDRAKYIQPKQTILITAFSKNSQLESIPTLQGITKKAITKKLTGSDERWDEDVEMQAVDITISIDHDIISVQLNTTGESLHERGYRQQAGDAPLKENLAAAMVLSSGRKFSTPLIDPFCGAGTIAIEAALIAKNIAPGLNRPFAFYGFAWYSPKYFQDAKAEAESKIMLNKQHTIIGYDIDPRMIDIAKNNAQRAGVADYIQFATRDFHTEKDIGHRAKEGIDGAGKKGLSIVTNPPYGERLKFTDLIPIYQKLVSLYEDNKDVNGGFITSMPEVLDLMQPSYWKETRYFNGPIECRFCKIARL